MQVVQYIIAAMMGALCGFPPLVVGVMFREALWGVLFFLICCATGAALGITGAAPTAMLLLGILGVIIWHQPGPETAAQLSDAKPGSAPPAPPFPYQTQPPAYAQGAPWQPAIPAYVLPTPEEAEYSTRMSLWRALAVAMAALIAIQCFGSVQVMTLLRLMNEVVVQIDPQATGKNAVSPLVAPLPEAEDFAVERKQIEQEIQTLKTEAQQFSFEQGKQHELERVVESDRIKLDRELRSLTTSLRYSRESDQQQRESLQRTRAFSDENKLFAKFRVQPKGDLTGFQKPAFTFDGVRFVGLPKLTRATFSHDGNDARNAYQLIREDEDKPFEAERPPTAAPPEVAKVQRVPIDLAAQDVFRIPGVRGGAWKGDGSRLFGLEKHPPGGWRLVCCEGVVGGWKIANGALLPPLEGEFRQVAYVNDRVLILRQSPRAPNAATASFVDLYDEQKLRERKADSAEPIAPLATLELGTDVRRLRCSRFGNVNKFHFVDVATGQIATIDLGDGNKREEFADEPAGACDISLGTFEQGLQIVTKSRRVYRYEFRTKQFAEFLNVGGLPAAEGASEYLPLIGTYKENDAFVGLQSGVAFVAQKPEFSRMQFFPEKDIIALAGGGESSFCIARRGDKILLGYFQEKGPVGFVRELTIPAAEVEPEVARLVAETIAVSPVSNGLYFGNGYGLYLRRGP